MKRMKMDDGSFVNIEVISDSDVNISSIENIFMVSLTDDQKKICREIFQNPENFFYRSIEDNNLLSMCNYVLVLNNKFILLGNPSVNVNIRIKNDFNLLTHATTLNNNSMVRALINRSDLLVNATTEDQTALMIASLHQYNDIVTTLLSRPDIDVNLVDSQNNTALSIAVMLNFEDVATQLLNVNNIDIDYVDESNNNLLMISLKNESVNIATLLIEKYKYMFDINHQNEFGETALIFACEHNLQRIVELMYITYDNVNVNLRNYNIDVNIRNNSGISALIYACHLCFPYIVGLLLNFNGINVNIRNNDNITALMFAAAKGCHNAVVFLLKDEDIDPDIMDNNGKTASYYAHINGYHNICLLFQKVARITYCGYQMPETGVYNNEIMDTYNINEDDDYYEDGYSHETNNYSQGMLTEYDEILIKEEIKDLQRITDKDDVYYDDNIRKIEYLKDLLNVNEENKILNRLDRYGIRAVGTESIRNLPLNLRNTIYRNSQLFSRKKNKRRRKSYTKIINE